MRPIDADALVEWLKSFTGFRSNCEDCTEIDCLDCVIEEAIKNAPTIDYASIQKIDGNTSDGYHTFNELYHHRAILFSVIVKAFPDKAWKSKRHNDGSMFNDMFIVGIETPEGQATYHYNIDPYWDTFHCKELEFAPEWDGHTASDAIERIGGLDPFDYGEWIEPDYVYFGAKQYICSKCKDNSYWKDHYHNYQENYCPNCGRKMNKEGRS